MKKKLINIGLVSLGCPKNLVDSEVLLAFLDNGKYKICQDLNDVEIVIINTCCFIKEALDESLETIEYLSRLKKFSKCIGLIVCGCLVERYGQSLFDKIPLIDALLGTTNQDQINSAINKIMKGEKFFSTKKKNIPWDPDSLVKLTPSHFAYLKISEGCRNPCTFCIIPKLRGPYRSRSMESIMKEAEELADAGVKELVLVGQDITSYGYDLYKELKISELVTGLCSIKEIEWIRLLYAYPSYVDDKLLRTFNSYDKVCKYLDLPLQHFSDNILSRMGRKQTGDELRSLIQMIRKEVPGITLRTTFIVGFPGETDSDFNLLLNFMSEMKFERLGIFTFSPEEGTLAYNYSDKVTDNVKEQRLEEAMLLQQDISVKINKSYYGKTVNVIIDGYDEPDNSILLGRTEYDAPEVDGMVYIHASETTLKPGDIVPVKITDTKEYDLVGKPAEEVKSE